MAFVYFNPNPEGNYVGDCSVRAISKLLDQDWDTTYWGLAITGSIVKDMPPSKKVIGTYLRNNGFTRKAIPSICPDCYSVRQFAQDYPDGIYLLATDSHVVTVIFGDYFDSWDSGDETVLYYWAKEK